MKTPSKRKVMALAATAAFALGACGETSKLPATAGLGASP